jgi:hypothetical protein
MAKRFNGLRMGFRYVQHQYPVIYCKSICFRCVGFIAGMQFKVSVKSDFYDYVLISETLIEFTCIKVNFNLY